MSRRKLSPDEIELWHKISQTAERLHPERTTPVAFLTQPKPVVVQQPRLQQFKIGAKAPAKGPTHDVLPNLTERLSAAPLNMDNKAFQKLKRGKLLPEGKIDLHGMTLDQAHPALVRFIMRAHADRKRLVLVITGKGKTSQNDGPIPVRRGVLRHQVPHWMQTSPLSGVILQVAEAHLKHGGSGAFYVYLRRV